MTRKTVMMLKEGWDVKNVTTIVGLRAYSAQSNILPEQTLGRGLRKMYPGNEVEEYVSVVGTDAFMVPKKSIFNKIIGDSLLELKFAAFLEECDDIVSYVKNYMAVHFQIDYVNADGNISNYYPDFIVKLSPGLVVIVETKGLEDLDVPLKMRRLREWCVDINKAQSDVHYDYVFVDEESFNKYKPKSFEALISGFQDYKD